MANYTRLTDLEVTRKNVSKGLNKSTYTVTVLDSADLGEESSLISEVAVHELEVER